MQRMIKWTFSRLVDLFLLATSWLAVKVQGSEWDWPTYVVEQVPESWTDHAS